MIEYYKIVETYRNLVRGKLTRTKVVLSMWLWCKRGEEKKERLYYEYKKDYFGFGSTHVRNCGDGESDST